jgi:spore cortex biosynthesis protein YabQ
MTVSDSAQAKIFLINILFGMICVFIFDFFRALRRRHRDNAIYANVTDALCFIAIFFIVIFAGIKYNFGAIRYYQLMGLFFGAFLHLLMFSRFEVRAIEVVINKTVKIFKFILKALTRPILFILRTVTAPFFLMEKNLMNGFAKLRRKAVKNKRKKAQNSKIMKKRIKMM